MLPRHLPALDGLRAIAVLLVLWTHVPVFTPGYPEWLLKARALIEPGGFGVEIFFVLSGFLITRILLAEKANDRPVRWFLLRRLLRIFPIYYLLIAIMTVIEPGSYIVWCALYASNVLTIMEPTRLFPLQHSWSLCIEEHFYLIWPLVIAFLPVTRPPRILAFVVLPGALIAALLVGYYGDPRHAHQVVQHASPIRFFSLGVGCLVAYAEPRIATFPGRFAGLAFALLLPAVLANNVVQFALIPYWFLTPALVPTQTGPALWLVSNCSLATSLLLLCLVSGHHRWSPFRLLCWRPLRGIGRISYGLYLYHLPIFHALLLPAPSGSRAALVIGLSFAAATASYWIVERPILRYGSKLR